MGGAWRGRCSNGTRYHSPFRAVSNKKSGFSLYQRGQHRSRHTYFPCRSFCRHLSIYPITPALPSISMARFFHQAGMWFNGVTKILLFRSPRPRGHESGALLDHVRRHRLQRSNPCLHPALRCSASLGSNVTQRPTLEYNIRIQSGRLELYARCRIQWSRFFHPAIDHQQPLTSSKGQLFTLLVDLFDLCFVTKEKEEEHVYLDKLSIG